MRRFPKITVDIALDKGCTCSKCPAVIPPFNVVYVVAISIVRDGVGHPYCKDCVKKEINQRILVLREDANVREHEVRTSPEGKA